MPASRKRLTGALALAVVASGLLLVPAAPAQADVSAKIPSLPYNQGWTDISLITANDDWSGHPGVQGYLGDGMGSLGTSTDPQTVTTAGTAPSTDVIANLTSQSATNGGVAEMQIADPAIAMQGSGTAQAPNLVMHLDLTGESNVTVDFDVRDLDSSADNTVQQVAFQYRVGTSGDYTNLAAGYVADATTGPSLATLVTNRSVDLPAAVDGAADVFIRWITTNAPSNDEWVGIDNIVVDESDAPPPPLAAADPGDRSGYAGMAITPITLSASGGVSPYTFGATGLPAGLGLSGNTISGTPEAAGTSTVTVTATDSATPTPATDSETFDIVVAPAPTTKTIAEIQGTDTDTSPEAGNLVITRGVVTARYPSGSGSMAGFVLQTGGEEGVDYDTPGASDAIFVFSGNKTAPSLGTTVEVKGVASERFKSTQISASGASDTITVLDTPQPPVVPNDVIPGTDCALPGTDCLTGAALDAAREEYEHEAFQPAGAYTVTDSYDGSPFDSGFGMQGEIGLAAESDVPLMIPTETIDQSDAAGLAARRAYNAAHMLVLDDAKSLDYTANANEDLPFPWITPDHPVRVGASVTFPKSVILKYDFGSWRILPQTEVAAGEDGQDLVSIENTRTSQPEDVLGDTGDLKIATFNMLNYFNTFGEPWAASDGTATGNPGTTYNFDNPRRCNYYRDRGTPGGASSTEVNITNDECAQDAKDPLTGLDVKLPGPRGAANEENFLRQEAKELEAINAIDADVMSLEEVENSIKLYDPAIDGPDGADKDRDDALKRLVQQLNAHWATAHPSYVGPRWAYAVSPRPEALPTVAEQDAIRSAFIYNPSKVETVGRSQVLVNSAPFRNAREPLAQAFKPLGGGREDAFVVIVNHFKSKGGPTAPATVNGDNVDAGDGAGFYNGDRKRQAAALVAFAEQVSADKNIDPVFFTGDFNSYSAEDPVQVIEAAGYENLQPTNGETTYSFGGYAGSLDHVFANEEALAMVTGEDIWDINAGESVYYEYSRYNASGSQLYAVNPFRSSDHNPEIIGIDVGDLSVDPDVDTVQILATNDFHGRLVDDPGSAAAGAAAMAGAVKGLRAENPDTIFAAAGDLIGASTFESFLQDDEPTIDALNEAGLEVSSVGNHEFDQGYDDLVTRVMTRTTWEYLGANVEFKDTEDGHAAGDPALPETWCQTLPNGRVVGFVGAVTEDLDTLVSASAIEDVVVTSIVDAVNEHADDLKEPDGCGAAGPADLVVELVHEGAASTAKSAVTDNSTFGKIVAGANENVDAIVSGHTHLAYNHKVTVPAWVTEGRAVTERPVVSAGQYGANLNRLQFEFAPGGGDLVNIRQTVLQLKDYDADPDTQAIVDDAVAYAETQGAAVLGDIEDEFRRARRVGDDGQVSESRGAESTLGNLIAEMQRWKTGADIGFMNPGGLRADLLGLDGTPREVTYRQAANAQPFANTLVTMDLTGAQIKKLLEQQWQRDADGNVPSRPFLRLGTSSGFTSTFDASKAEGSRITGMWLNGTAIDPQTTYRVSATSFLAGAGDNFWAFSEGDVVKDTGFTDLQAVVEYLAEFAEHDTEVLPVDYAQHQVGITFPGGAPSTYEAGSTLSFDVSSLAMTGVDDVQDTQVTLELDGVQVGPSFPVTNTLTNDLFDNVGRAQVSVTVPAVEDGTTVFTLVGNNTGTEIPVRVRTNDGLTDVTVAAQDQSVGFGEGGSVPVTVVPADATGTGTLLDGATELGQVTLTGGAGSIAFEPGLAPGAHELTLAYSGDSTHNSSQGTVTITVAKAVPTVGAIASPATVAATSGTSDITVTVTSAAAGDATGTVTASVGGAEVDSATLTGGAATLTVGPFATVGDKTVTIDYSGDGNTAAGSATTTVSVVKAGTTVSATGGPATYGTSWNATVTVDPTTASGQVEIFDNTTSLGTATLANGTATVAIGGVALQPGPHTLTVEYHGDDGHEESTNTLNVTVGKRASSVAATGGTVQVDTAWTSQVTVTPSSATGQVEILDGARSLGTATLSGGSASVGIARDALQAGTHSLTVNYGGDATHSGSTSSLVVTVAPPGTSKTPTSTSATAQPMTWGTNGVVAVTVAPMTATGGITISEGGTVVGSGGVTNGTGTVTIDGTALEPGSHTLAVRYAGSDTHEPSQGTVVVQVAKAATTLSASAGPVDAGSDATVSVSATPGTAEGAVTLTEGGATVGGGTLVDGAASITVSGLAPGSHALTVQYAGDAHHTAATTTVTVVVSKAASTTSASVSPATIEVGDRARVAVTVSADGVTPTGRVVAVVNGEQVDSATLADGQATLRVGPFGRPGTKTVQIRYAGDDQVAASSTSVSVEVEKATVDLSVSHSPRKVKVDKTKVKLSVDLGTRGFKPGGTVSIRLGGQPNQTASVNGNGKVSFRLQAFGSTGAKTITVVYSGDDRVKGATVAYTIDVVRR